MKEELQNGASRINSAWPEVTDPEDGFVASQAPDYVEPAQMEPEHPTDKGDSAEDEEVVDRVFEPVMPNLDERLIDPETGGPNENPNVTGYEVNW